MQALPATTFDILLYKNKIDFKNGSFLSYNKKEKNNRTRFLWSLQTSYLGFPVFPTEL